MDRCGELSNNLATEQARVGTLGTKLGRFGYQNEFSAAE